jgi:hypothetical protein
LVYDTKYKLLPFIDVLARLLSSNIFLFETLYSEKFYSWVDDVFINNLDDERLKIFVCAESLGLRIKQIIMEMKPINFKFGNIGFCPVDYVLHSNCFPFSITQIIKFIHYFGRDKMSKVTIDEFLQYTTLASAASLCISTEGSDDTYTGESDFDVNQCLGPFYCPCVGTVNNSDQKTILIPKFMWPMVYGSSFTEDTDDSVLFFLIIDYRMLFEIPNV